MTEARQEGGFYEQSVGKINPVLVEHYYGSRMEGSKAEFPYLLHVMEAHALTLRKSGIISEEIAKKLLGGIAEMRGESPVFDPRLEDLYINFETILSKKVGKDICGHLPVARSRNDVEAASRRMKMRDRMFTLADSLLLMIDILHDRAAESMDYVTPGYTYRQQAQPVTMGHYLLGVSEALLRDAERIRDSVARLNYNPLGAAAMAGTRFPVDRAFSAELMGFTGVFDNAQDAVASADFVLEPLNAALLCLSTLARLAGDIINWCSNEVGIADLPLDLIDSSSIMPQKRNPVICETVRSFARVLAGRYAGLVAASTVEFEASRDVTVVIEDALSCILTVNDMCRISAEYTKSLIFKPEEMMRILNMGFSNATELADSLVIDGGLNFRAAHTVVGSAIASLYKKGLKQEDLTYELLDTCCRETTGAPLPLDRQAVEAAKDFRNCVERRDIQGSTARARVEKSLSQQRAQAQEMSSRFAGERKRWADAKERMHKLSQEICKG